MKAVTLVLLWLVGSAAAIGVAWSGVGVLDDDLVAPAPAVINAGGEVGLVSESVGPLDDSSDDTGFIEDTESADEASSTTSIDRSTLAVAGDDRSPSTSTSSSTTVRGASTGASSSTTNTTAGGSASSSSTATTSAGTDPEQYETRTFTLTGGATAIRFSPSATKVLWAAPNPGYEVRIEPESGGVKVEFRSDDHRSRIDAWWDNGPRHQIREED